MNDVVYCCPFVPAEWIAAHGLRPCRIVPSGEAAGEGQRGRHEDGGTKGQGDGGTEGRRDGGAEGTANDQRSTVNDQPESRNPNSEIGPYAGLCPFARAFAGSVLRMGSAAGVVVTTACDQMRRIADWLDGQIACPVFLMNVPSTCTPAAHGLYASELCRLGAFLVTLGGESPSAQTLAGVMREYEAVRASSAARVNLVSAAASRAHRIPLALVGGPLLRGDFELFELIEQAGGQVVLDGTETGERTQPAIFDAGRLEADPFAELVRAYFGAIPEAFRRPDRLLHEWLGREIAARGVRGVIVHRYVWCDNWHAEVSRLKETLGVPVLDLDGSGASNGEQARARARIEAFVEMLQ